MSTRQEWVGVAVGKFDHFDTALADSGHQLQLYPGASPDAPTEIGDASAIPQPPTSSATPG